MSTSGVAADDLTTERVWREFGSSLRDFVGRRIVDPDRADDVTGEIALRIHQNLHRVDDREHLTRWLYRIARNAIIDEYRRTDRERARSGPALTDEVAEPAVDLPDDDPSEVSRELSRCLRPLLSGLSPEQRRAVELTELGGHSQADAAGIEGVSVSGMKSRVQRGRRHLAELLGQCCELTLDARGMPMDYTAPGGCAC